MQPTVAAPAAQVHSLMGLIDLPVLLAEHSSRAPGFPLPGRPAETASTANGLCPLMTTLGLNL